MTDGLFDPEKWPNLVIHSPTGHSGVSWFSKDEIERRQKLVRKELKRIGADALMVQGYFPPATMGCHTMIYWLTGCNSHKNTVTLILPQEGELQVIQGMKTSSNHGARCPYLAGDDIGPFIRGVKRLAYARLGQIGLYFHEYLLQTVPGLEIVDFSDSIEYFMAVKSNEEIEAIKNTCAIQDRVFASAASFIQPGRCGQEITADIVRLLQLLGADPTLMPKILIMIGSNSASDFAAKPGYMLQDPYYRLKDTDYVRLCLETPGSGGYYAERARCFFFRTPHPEIRQLWAEAMELHEYQSSLYRPGMSMKQLRSQINEYKLSHGMMPFASSGVFDTEIRGIGMLTVDRPQIQYDWESIALEPGISIVSMAHVIKGGKSFNIFDTCIITQDKPYYPGSFPLDLVVL